METLRISNNGPCAALDQPLDLPAISSIDSATSLAATLTNAKNQPSLMPDMVLTKRERQERMFSRAKNAIEWQEDFLLYAKEDKYKTMPVFEEDDADPEYLAMPLDEWHRRFGRYAYNKTVWNTLHYRDSPFAIIARRRDDQERLSDLFRARSIAERRMKKEEAGEEGGLCMRNSRRRQ